MADTGVGISEEEIPKIFDKFQQFGKIKGQKEKGTGLGLYIVKAIVELHGGRIWAKSRVNKGSRFYFTLPRAESRNGRRMKTAARVPATCGANNR